MTGIEVRIYKNLEERINGVADHIALNGIDDVNDGYHALRNMVKAGTIECERLNVALPGFSAVYKNFYKLSWNARMENPIAIRRVK